MRSSPVAQRAGEVDRRASAETEGAHCASSAGPLHRYAIPLPLRLRVGGGACGLLLLAACGAADRQAAAPPAAPSAALDCAKGFDALAAELAAQPDLVQAPSPGEPYRFLNHRSGSPSYVVTLPEAPAHPAILMQRTVGGAMQTTGCRYGDEAAYGQLVAYIESLRTHR